MSARRGALLLASIAAALLAAAQPAIGAGDAAADQAAAKAKAKAARTAKGGKPAPGKGTAGAKAAAGTKAATGASPATGAKVKGAAKAGKPVKAAPADKAAAGSKRAGKAKGAQPVPAGAWVAPVAAPAAAPAAAAPASPLAASAAATAATAAGVGAAAPAAPAEAGPRTSGQVVQVTPARAFLDAGARDGLRAGDAVELRRGSELVGRCTIDRVADRSASCTGAAARAGDRFALGPPPAPPRPAALPPIVPAAELARRKQALEGAILVGVEFNPGEPQRAPPAPRVFLRASQSIWAATDASTWSGQRIDVRVIGAQLTDGSGALPATQLTLDASAVHLSRPGGAFYRPGADAQLFVWEAALASRGERGPSFAFGRVLPWYAPGATRLDGAQLGWRLRPGVELGVFGGGVPDPATLEPAFSRATAGAYWALDHSGARSDLVPYASTTGRAAWVRSPEAGKRFEVESSSVVQLGTVANLAADLRLGVGDVQGPGALDAARVSAELRPTESLSLTGSFRYAGAALLEDTALAVASGPSHHADAALAWTATRALVLGLEGGLARDDTSGGSFGRSWAGPTLALPKLFGSAGGLSAGAHLERGDLPGASGWLGATLLPGDRVQILLRATGALDNRPAGRDLTLGLFGSARAQLFDHLALQCTLLLRLQPVALGNLPPDLMGGVFADLGLRSEF